MTNARNAALQMKINIDQFVFFGKSNKHTDDTQRIIFDAQTQIGIEREREIKIHSTATQTLHKMKFVTLNRLVSSLLLLKSFYYALNFDFYDQHSACSANNIDGALKWISWYIYSMMDQLSSAFSFYEKKT